MKFPEKYIKRGQYKLHSGEMTGVFYDVNAMLTNREQLFKITEFITGHKVGDDKLYIGKPLFDTYVGIATGGAIIAGYCGIFMNSNWAMVKDGELKGEVGNRFCLIDDVVTTEGSFVDAIDVIGREAEKYLVVVDRRKGQKFMDISSMYEV